MDTNIYHEIVILSESSSFSQAAKKMFISQPALTKKVAKLEESLDCEIVSRGTGPMVFTEQGKIFLKYARKYLDLEQQLNNEIRTSLESNANVIKVATTHRGGDLAGRTASAFNQQYPDLILEYSDYDAFHCEDVLLKGLADVAIYTSPVISQNIEYMPLSVDTLLLVTRRDNPLLKGKNLTGNSIENPLVIDPRELNQPEVRFILSTENHSLYYAECAFLKKYNLSPRKAHRIDYVDTRYTVASTGGGIVLVPTTTIHLDRYPDNVCMTVKGGIQRYIIIAKNRETILSDHAQAYWDYMITHFLKNTAP